MVQFSVIIPTRNRAGLLRRALASVASQVGADFEIIVVNDGTSDAERPQLDELKSQFAETARFLDLPLSPSGNGCFRVMNTGVANASGEYVCFLDDDDEWVDQQNLADARRIIAGSATPVDIICFNQDAYRGHEKATGPIWLEDLGERLIEHGLPGPDGSFAVGLDELLTAHGFAHTNTTIVRKEFFIALGGFDTSLWYEGDRDFFLRWIDTATTIRYLPKVCARHNIPDTQQRNSMTNTTSAFKKAVDQFSLLNKAARSSRHPALRRYASKHRRYALRKAIGAASTNPTMLIPLVRRVTKAVALFSPQPKVVDTVAL